METADVDMDLYTAVTPDYSRSANGFTGTVDKITIELEAMTPAGEDAAKKAGAESNEVERIKTEPRFETRRKQAT
jgi:hypothetical protein